MLRSHRLTNQTSLKPPSGAGLGFRRAMIREMDEIDDARVSFLEVAPENWIGLGGRLGKVFRSLTERFPFATHGLSLSVGGPAGLDIDLVRDIKKFLDTHQIDVYTEHLSYCSDAGQLYDLMPIPFTSEAVIHVAARIRQVQDILERRIGIENVSYYAAPGQELTEIEFFSAVIAEADCGVLLDVNNIYVNSINHSYDPVEFLAQMPKDRIMYAHVAGHYHEAVDLRVDTHGAPVIDPVWELLAKAYHFYGVMPTLLERDFNLPPMPELLLEVDKISEIQKSFANKKGSLVA